MRAEAEMIADSMPRAVALARVLLFLLGGITLVAALLALAGSGSLPEADDDAGVGISPAAVYAVEALVIALGVAEVVVAARFAAGGPGVRMAGVGIAALVLAGSLFGVAVGAAFVAAGPLVGSAVIVVGLSTRQAVGWFGRARM